MIARILAAATVFGIGAATAARAAGSAGGGGVVVHEWGTFTSLQDEAGRALGGINSDDEPVPGFVHSLDPRLMVDARAGGVGSLAKGAPACHPDVTMRLETPVVYFHLPAGCEEARADVRVRFRGGWLTQFYPWAEAEIDGGSVAGFDGGRRRLTSQDVGELAWKDLRVGGTVEGPVTPERVWVAPRRVEAAGVVSSGGEGERYLFYRGVGHVDSPLRVVRERRAGGDVLVARWEGKGLGPRPVWLLDVRGDGTAAYRRVERAGAEGLEVEAGFAASEYSAAAVGRLRGEMREVLVAEGLFADEAEALLNTWEASYFKGVGERVMFVVPRRWVEGVLPLEVSVAGEAAEVRRVMVGRVEVVGPRERGLLARLVTGGKRDEGVWRELGRFRDALWMEEARRRAAAAAQEKRVEPRMTRINAD